MLNLFLNESMRDLGEWEAPTKKNPDYKGKASTSLMWKCKAFCLDDDECAEFGFDLLF